MLPAPDDHFTPGPDHGMSRSRHQQWRALSPTVAGDASRQAHLLPGWNIGDFGQPQGLGTGQGNWRGDRFPYGVPPFIERRFFPDQAPQLQTVFRPADHLFHKESRLVLL